jgi:hypothetical protein
MRPASRVAELGSLGHSTRMGFIKVTGRDAKPALMFLTGLLLTLVCGGLSYFSVVFLYAMFGCIAVAVVGLVWSLLRRRHDVA